MTELRLTDPSECCEFPPRERLSAMLTIRRSVKSMNFLHKSNFFDKLQTFKFYNNRDKKILILWCRRMNLKIKCQQKHNSSVLHVFIVQNNESLRLKLNAELFCKALLKAAKKLNGVLKLFLYVTWVWWLFSMDFAQNVKYRYQHTFWGAEACLNCRYLKLIISLCPLEVSLCSPLFHANELINMILPVNKRSNH